MTVLVITVALLLTGCAGDNEPDAPETPPFNSADVTFVHGMIPHHRQAIQMAHLAEERAATPAVQQLAQQIKTAQSPEIAKMQEWLQAWGKPLQGDSGGGMGSMDHGRMTGMSGMLSTSDMQQLRSVQGAAFDEAFLSLMIAHHKGAIDMAETEERQGTNPQAVALAKKIQQDQSAEIEKMSGMLGG